MVRKPIIMMHQGASTVAWLPSRLEFVELDQEHRVFAELLEANSYDLDTARNCAGDLFGSGPAARLAEDYTALLKEPGKDDSTAVVVEPMGFRIVLSEKCNFGCPKCFSTTALMKSGQILRTMTQDTLARTIQRVILPWSKRKPLTAHFFGGEPMLQFSLIEYAVGALQEQVERGLAHSVNFLITTNGSLLPPTAIEFFRKHNFDVGVSVELTPEIHDLERPRRNGRGTFDLVRENYAALVSSGCTAHILVTPYSPLPENARECLETLLDLFPCKSFTVNTPFEEHSLGWVGVSEHLSFLMIAQDVARRRTIQVDSALTPILAAISTGTRRLSPQATLGGEVMLGIAPDGTMVRSTHAFTGSLKVLSELDIIRSLWAPDCQSCEAQFVCGGPNEEFQLATGTTLDPQKCEFHRSALRAIAANLSLFTVHS